MYLLCRYSLKEEAMRSRILKWGNSLAVRIPKAFADEIRVGQGSSIQMMVENGSLMIVPEREPEWTLEALLAGITEENLHSPWETGAPEGEENW
jgi:antitoxin MazE